MYLDLRTGKIIYESEEEKQRVTNIIKESVAKAFAFAYAYSCSHDDVLLSMLEDSFGGEQDGKKQNKS